MPKDSVQFPQVTVTETGFRLSGGMHEPVDVSWDDVAGIVAFKRDVVAWDVICLAFRLAGKEELIEVAEDFPGYERFIRDVETRFELPENWWRNVAFPAFATNWTTIWESETTPPQNCRPLRYPDGWPVPPGRVELMCRWIPIVGWIVSAYLEGRRLQPGEDAILAQLSERRPIPDSVWGSDARRIDAAKRIVDCCVQAIGWEHPFFIPDDPFEMMICLRTGDCCELDAVFRIEQVFQVRLKHSNADLIRWMEDRTTFAEIVDLIIEMSPRYAAREVTSP